MPRIVPQNAAELIALINTRVRSSVSPTPMRSELYNDIAGAFYVARLASRAELKHGKTLDIDLAEQTTNILTRAVDKAITAGRFK